MNTKNKRDESRYTHNTLIGLETAKLLTEAGFNWEADTQLAFWENLNCERDSVFCDGLYIYQAAHPDCWGGKWVKYYRPTQEIAQKWLRETHDVYVTPIDDCDSNGVHWHLRYLINPNTPKKAWFGFILDEGNDKYHKLYSTIEEAIEEGLQKCLKIIIKDKNK